jgi:hypothetical protein
MPSNARNLANLLGAGETTISAEKLGSDVAPGTEDYSSIDSLGAGTIVGETAFVEGSNRLYIWNGSGWYNIALINTTPTWDSGGQPASSYVLDADSPQDATVITLAASDPEGLPISYNYITGGSMDSIATISQDSSVFTITPKTSTQVPDGGTGSITFRATDGVNILPQVSSFTLNFVNIIDDSKHTTLLATATGTSDNNNITDASTNNHSITVNGDAHAGTFSPYRSGGYSGLFDSTSVVQLSFAGSSDFEFGSANFTIEMWFKWNSSSKPDTTIFSNRISGSTFTTGSYFLKLMPGDITTGGIEFAFDCGSRYRLNCVDNLTADDAFFDEGWHHYAAVRNGTSLKLFVDGQEVDEITLPANETNFGNSSVNIGLGINNGVSSPSGPDGEYRDVRIVKGVAITPPSGGPTETLDAVSGTTFLLYNGEGYVKDKTSNHSPTYGSTAPTITATSPYDYLEYSATDHGGSVYFDVDGDWITATGIDLSSARTIEFWYYKSTNSTVLETIFSIGNGYTDNVGVSLFTRNGDFEFRVGSSIVYDSGLSLDLFNFTWHHIAIVISSSNSADLYINGSRKYSGSNVTRSNSMPISIGSSVNGLTWNNTIEMQGFISDFAIFNSAKYSGTTLTIPTSPLSSSGSELHIKGTDASIIDKSQSANLKLIGNTTGSTTQVKFADTKSMYFDGTGDYIPVITDFFYEKNTSNASTTKFTIETWVYHTARLTSSGYNHIFQTIVGLGNVGMSFGIGPSGNLKFYHQSSSTNVVTSTSTIPLNTWTHIAVIVDGSQGSNGVTLKINGSTDGTGSWNGISTSQSDQSLPFSNPHFTIGRYPDPFASHQQFEGYLQDLRISNIARTITSAPSAPLEG